MKKILLTISIFITSLFMFSAKTSAITALCAYEANDGSKAYIILENYKKYIYFDKFDIYSVDDTINLGPVVPITSILSFATLANYFPSIMAGQQGMSLYFDPTYNNVTVESFMYDNFETKFQVTWLNATGNTDPAVKLNFKNGNRCPQILFYDGDGAISIESAEIRFSSGLASDMSDSWPIWANNKVYSRSVDLITDNYKSSNTVSILRSINSALDGNGCSSPLSGSQSNMDLALSYLTLSVSYGDITGSEKHFIAKGIDYGSEANSSTDEHYSYIELAKKIDANANADEVVSNSCNVDATGLRKAAQMYKHAYEVTSDFGTEDVEDCQGIIGDPNEEGTFAFYLQMILSFIQYGGVGLVVVLTIVELTKAVASSDKDEVNKVINKTLTRVIFMVLLFVVPIIIKLMLDIFNVYGDCGIK